jgi:hypothetical protein
LQLLLFSSTTMPPKNIADDGAPKGRKPRAPKERPPGWTNAAWAVDVERLQTVTRGRAERENKLAAKRAAAADEHARLVSMSMGQSRVGQFPGPWPTQGTIGSSSTYSLASPAISPALRRGPLSFSNGMPPPNDGVMHDMITSGSMAAASSPGFFTQEEAKATEAVASRGAIDDQNDGFGDGTQDVDEEE